jgi:hypothetical protein
MENAPVTDAIVDVPAGPVVGLDAQVVRQLAALAQAEGHNLAVPFQTGCSV